MDPILNRNLFSVREQVGLLTPTFSYDILDPENGTLLLECREESLTRLTRAFRFSDLKRTTPFDLQVRTPDQRPILRLRRGVPVFASRVRVYDHDDHLIGGFNQKALSLTGAYDVVDAEGNSVCQLQGRLSKLSFRFVGPGDLVLAEVSRKWSGLGKELFTSATDYMLSIDERVPPDSTTRQLVLASVLCIGMIQKVDIP